MKHPIRMVVASLFVLGLGGQVYAQTSIQSAIDVDRPWARATPAGAKTAAAYMTLINKGDTADRLVVATTPVADKIQFHSVSEDNGVSRMREMHSIEIASGARVIFSPGGMHIMLVGLKKPLKEGEPISMTLTFEKAGKVDVSIPVAKVGAMQPGLMMHEHSDTTTR